MQTIQIDKKLFYICKIMALVPLLLGLIGCASEYPCGEPGIGRCASVSDNYRRSFSSYTNPDDVAKTSFWGSSDDKQTDKAIKYPALGFANYRQIPSDGSPLISHPTMLRVWLTPYTDSDNIYHEQSYEYVLTDKGHWLYGNNRLNVNEGVKNISLAQSSSTAASSVGSGSGLPMNSGKANNPSAFLKDYPAFNALNNQSVPVIGVPVTTTTTGLNKTTIVH